MLKRSKKLFLTVCPHRIVTFKDASQFAVCILYVYMTGAV